VKDRIAVDTDRAAVLRVADIPGRDHVASTLDYGQVITNRLHTLHISASAADGMSCIDSCFDGTRLPHLVCRGNIWSDATPASAIAAAEAAREAVLSMWNFV